MIRGFLINHAKSLAFEAIGELRPGEFWQKGDALLGDPPHELQGWYGVYNTDTTTQAIIKRASDF